MFSDNGPGPASIVTDDWFNDVQENLCQFIEGAGITLVKGSYTQLAAAVAAFIATHNAVTNPHLATALATASRLVLRDASGRAAFGTPSAAGDAATKGYVDAGLPSFPAAAEITGLSNWTNFGSIYQPSLRGVWYSKLNGIVSVTFGLMRTTADLAAGSGLGFVLPEGFRPASFAGFTAYKMNGGSGAIIGTAHISVNAMGVCACDTLVPSTGQTWLMFEATFVARN
jgi:hypothetical protein